MRTPDPRPTDPAALRRAADEIRTRPTNLGPSFPRPGGGGLQGAIDRAGAANTSGLFDPSRPGELQLPEPAATKLRAMRAAAEDLDTARRALSDRRAEAIQTRERALARLRQLEQGSARFFQRSDTPAFAEAEAARDGAAAQLADLDRRIADLRARSPRVLSGIDQYLRSLPPGIVVELAPPVMPKKGATVESVRTQIAELRADLHATRSAPLHSSAVKALWRADITARAERCAPNVGDTLEGAAVQWPHTLTRAELYGHAVSEGAPQIAGFAQQRSVDVLGLMCWLAGEALMEKISEEIDAEADDAGALSDDDRAEREAALLSQILELGYVEETLIEASGAEVARRADADPRAVLGLSSDLPAPRE